MITSEGKARQSNSYQKMQVTKESYDKTMEYVGARKSTGENLDHYFDNFEPGDTRWVSSLWNISPLILEFILYFSILVYLFTLETALVGIIMPIAGVSVIYFYLLIAHLSSMSLKKKGKRKKKKFKINPQKYDDSIDDCNKDEIV